ncbi:MAG: ABC transporter substrate-binding protein [Candidatus Binatia bacterium]
MKQLFSIPLIVAVIVVATMVEAQQTTNLPRIGFLFSLSPNVNTDRIEAFRHGLRELGYVDGKNVVIEYRYAEGKRDRLNELAAELARLKVAVIVSGGPAVTRPAKEATHTIPIVMAQDSDPVGNKFVASLARPGGNITGLSALAPEISGKRLEILKEILPKLSRAAIFGTSTFPGNKQSLKETELAAGAVGVQIHYLDVRTAEDIETAFRESTKKRPDAAVVLAGAVIFSQRTRIAGLAVKNRLPVIFPQSEYVEDGGLLSYAPNYPDLFRRAATFVDKILKGAKPSDLPVEQPTKFELIINLKAAKQIGLTIPPNVLARADRVIR